MSIQFRSNPLLEVSAKGALMFGGYLAAQYTIGNPLSDFRLRLVIAGLSAIANVAVQGNFRNLREGCGLPREVSVFSCLRPREFLAGFVAGQAFIGGLHSFKESADIPTAWGILPAASLAYLLVSEFLFHSVKQCALLIKNRQERPLEMDAVQGLAEVFSVVPPHDHQNCQEGGCLMRNSEGREGIPEGYAAL